MKIVIRRAMHIHRTVSELVPTTLSELRPTLTSCADSSRAWPSETVQLRRQFRARLLGHHVRGVPVGPVLVSLPAGPRFVLAVGDRRAP